MGYNFVESSLTTVYINKLNEKIESFLKTFYILPAFRFPKWTYITYRNELASKIRLVTIILF